MARAKVKFDPIEADLKWDSTQKRWLASARDSAGKPLALQGRSTTKAIRRLTKVLEEDFARPIEVKQRFHIPREINPRFLDFDKKLKLFDELRDFITKERLELAELFVNTYQVPITTIAPILGMSAQRLGMVMQNADMGIVPGKVGRPRAQSDDDDDDDD